MRFSIIFIKFYSSIFIKINFTRKDKRKIV